jgi:Rhamnogalacturonate lyase family.
MNKLLVLLLSVLLSVDVIAADGDVTMTVNGMTTKMSDGTWSITINSNGRVSSLQRKGTEFLSSNGIYFDYTTSEGNKGLSPSKVTVIKNTAEHCEVLYSATSGNTIFEQGFIMRKGVPGLYSYVIATGTATSANEPIKEARVCSRLADTMLNGYVDWRMNGRIPSNSEMATAEKSENTIQDATYRMADGSVYTKYNWANYIERDTLHGLYGNTYYGLYNIPVSYEWINGGCERQELTVHATSKSPITIQMLQGEHFGGQAMVLNEGEKKLYGPFLICTTYSKNPVASARNQWAKEVEAWPYQWFENPLYPRERGTVRGHLNVTTGQRNDSVRIILAQEKGKDPLTMMHGYQFWTLTDENGDFELKHVRPGDYNLFAYAKAGEVTDMLEQDDITVSADDNNLGTISWTPKKYSEMLWMIGQNDRRSSEFYFSDALRQYGLWEQVPANLTYTIGESKEATNWYYAQTQKNGTWTVKFNLNERPTGRVYLTASLAGCSGTGSTITVKVNGTQRATWKPGINDASVYRSAINSGRHYVYTTDFINTGLKVGENIVTFTYSGGGSKDGIMYDCIKMEAGELVTGIDNVSIDNQTPPQPAKYLHKGRLVIERGGQLYTVDGKRLSAKQ